MKTPNEINVLIACEESQAVCEEFYKRGFNAYSCDLKDATGSIPERHIKGDCFDAIKSRKWDLIIAHPPCTYLAVCGNRWFKNNPGRQLLREEAIDFFKKFLELDCQHIAIENPIGVISTRVRKPNQIIEPWQFGESFSKKTCLWLIGLPDLIPTEIVDKGEITTFGSGKRMPKWYGDLWGLSKEERQTMRSKTFRGIAKAMAKQWGDYLINGQHAE